MAGDAVKRLEGSYTIEAVYVMAVVFWVLAGIIQYSFRIHDQTKSHMTLQTSLEMERQTSDKSEVAGITKIGNRSLNIVMKPFHPEDFMRKCTLLEVFEERKDGD